MANKKKRKQAPRPRPAQAETSDDAATGGPPPRGGANPARRERKEQARAAREAERKRAARSASVRRAAIFSCVGLAAFGVLWWMQRASAPRPLPQAATNAIKAAGCRYDTGPAGGTIERAHLTEGASTTYPSVPATTGNHDPAPLPNVPRVYEEPVPETRAVHYLEHAGVIVYFRPGEQGVAQPVIDKLTSVANDSKNMIVAPRDDLPADTDFSVTAWNKVVNCSKDITPEQAATIASGFVEAFACTKNAPEPQNCED
jgi:hypothetical protein